MRWYLAPARISKFVLGYPCVLLKFWSNGHACTYLVDVRGCFTQCYFGPWPSLALLNHNTLDCTRACLHLLMTAAKQTIAKAWKSPKWYFLEVKNRITQAMIHGQIETTIQDRIPQHLKTWQPWVNKFLPPDFDKSLLEPWFLSPPSISVASRLGPMRYLLPHPLSQLLSLFPFLSFFFPSTSFSHPPFSCIPLVVCYIGTTFSFFCLPPGHLVKIPPWPCIFVSILNHFIPLITTIFHLYSLIIVYPFLAFWHKCILLVFLWCVTNKKFEQNKIAWTSLATYSVRLLHR